MLVKSPGGLPVTSYWNNYYSGNNVPALPSQFAVFVASETSPSMVVDLGCGNGRDSLFFARRHLPIICVDASQSAIDHCAQAAAAGNLERASFICSDIAAPDLAAKLNTALGSAERDVLLYSRFFLHAIDEEAQLALFNMANDLLLNRTGWFALEFRTPEDQDRQKETPAHYRRYVPLEEVAELGRKLDFTVAYQVQGLGMAKYKADDAYVARVLFARR